MTDKKSDDYYIDIPEGISKSAIQDIVANAAEQSGLYISHIGGYSRSKYPNSVHWHFKRSPQETGLLDATFWDVKSLLWLMIRHREPAWVHDLVPHFINQLNAQVRSFKRNHKSRRGK